MVKHWAKPEVFWAWLVAILIFLIPSNLFFKFGVEQAYVRGLLVDYLIPKIYLSDMVLGGLFVSWLVGDPPGRGKFFSFMKHLWHSSKWGKLFFITLLGLVVSQWWTPHRTAAFWYLLKCAEVTWLGWWVTTHSKKISVIPLKVSLIATLAFQTLLAVYQFLTQHSLAGYWLLGEPQLSRATGLAKATWWGRELVLPYGTTAHPNVLAGVVVLYGLLVLRKWGKNTLVILLMITTVLLTQSFSAGLVLVFYAIYTLLIFQKKRFNRHKKGAVIITIILLAPLLLHQATFLHPQNVSLSRRDFLNRAAVSMFVHQPLRGVGLNNFTATVEQFASTPEVVRFVQPVHNIWLLWLSETGLIGMFLIISLFYLALPKICTSPAVFILLPITVLDHYLLTLQTGLLLLVLWITLYGSFSQRVVESGYGSKNSPSGIRLKSARPR